MFRHLRRWKLAVLALSLGSTIDAIHSSQTVFITRDRLLEAQDQKPIFPEPLPVPFARSHGDEIYSLVTRLSRKSRWIMVERISFGNYTEPEGMVRVGENHFFVSHNIYTEGTIKYPSPIYGHDRSTGAGFGYVAM